MVIAVLLQELGLEALSQSQALCNVCPPSEISLNNVQRRLYIAQSQALCNVLPPSEISLNLSAQACLSVSSEITQH